MNKLFLFLEFPNLLIGFMAIYWLYVFIPFSTVIALLVMFAVAFLIPAILWSRNPALTALTVVGLMLVTYAILEFTLTAGRDFALTIPLIEWTIFTFPWGLIKAFIQLINIIIIGIIAHWGSSLFHVSHLVR